jgi:hypothetical protein
MMTKQNPSDFRVISHLGWENQANGFVTYEGLITKDGLNRTANVRPAKELTSRSLVNHYYGFSKSEQETREVLNEVLTFHDETFTSVFTSWMVSCVAKGQLVRMSSLFPIFLVQASRESGKTKGFAQLIYQMFGNRSKEGGIGTTASIRNAITAHRGAPIHIDDPDNVDNIKEMLRQVSVEGALDKTGEDKKSTVRSLMLAPVWISMEGSRLLEDKALADRIVTMSLPNPKGRRSLKNPSRAQWDDILEMLNKFGDDYGLTAYSGTLVHMILRSTDRRLSEFTGLRQSSGRYGDKMAILRWGARVLSDVTGDPSHVKRVDSWVSEQIDTGEENVLTTKLIPAALAFLGHPSEPVRINSQPFYGLVSPVVVCPAPGSDPGTPNSVWVSISNLALWWARHQNNKVSERTETLAALTDQGVRIGMKGGKLGERNVDWAQFTVVCSIAGTPKRERPRYLRLPDEIGNRLLDASGISPLDHGASPPGSRLNLAQQTAIEGI